MNWLIDWASSFSYRFLLSCSSFSTTVLTIFATNHVLPSFSYDCRSSKSIFFSFSTTPSMFPPPFRAINSTTSTALAKGTKRHTFITHPSSPPTQLFSLIQANFSSSSSFGRRLLIVGSLFERRKKKEMIQVLSGFILSLRSQLWDGARFGLK